MELTKPEILEYCKHMRIIQESIVRLAKIVNAELDARFQVIEESGQLALDEFYLYPTIHNCQIALLSTAQELVGVEVEPGQDKIRQANDEIKAMAKLVRVLSADSSANAN